MDTGRRGDGVGGLEACTTGGGVGAVFTTGVGVGLGVGKGFGVGFALTGTGVCRSSLVG